MCVCVCVSVSVSVFYRHVLTCLQVTPDGLAVVGADHVRSSTRAATDAGGRLGASPFDEHCHKCAPQHQCASSVSKLGP